MEPVKGKAPEVTPRFQVAALTGRNAVITWPWKDISMSNVIIRYLALLRHRMTSPFKVIMCLITTTIVFHCEANGLAVGRVMHVYGAVTRSKEKYLTP